MPELHEHPLFAAAMRIERRIRTARPHLRDPLGAYRVWLDHKGIIAEQDGWPSAIVLATAMVDRFLQETAG